MTIIKFEYCTSIYSIDKGFVSWESKMFDSCKIPFKYIYKTINVLGGFKYKLCYSTLCAKFIL